MNILFKEYMNMLEDKTGLVLKEGYYWLDNSIIKAFDKQGNLHKLYRVVINDDLTMSIKIPKGYSKESDFEIESWQETVERNKEHLLEIENQSLNLIRNRLDDIKTPIILTSGGKDSSVVLYLVRTIKDDVKAIFNNTTLDCADTYLHIKTIDNIETITPKQGFYQWRKENNFIPTRFARSCCSIFKESATVDYLDSNINYQFFMGMRNEESATRKGYSDDWHNDKWSDNWSGVLPIRKWSELDVWLYILLRNIPINSKYRKGYSRVGCAISCPFYNKSTWILDDYFYPKMRKRWLDILEKDFIDNGKACVLNCTLKEYLQTSWNGGIVREEPNDEIIEEFMEHKGISDKKIAEKYFNNSCFQCNKKLKKDIIGLNMKYFGRQTNKMYCEKCLGKILDKTKEDFKNDIESFKQSGCNLF